MNNWRTVGSIIKFNTKGITPKYVEKSNVMVLNQKCIRNHVIDYSFAQYTDDSKKIPENKLIKKGDILINSTGQGTAGRCAFVSEIPEDVKLIADSHILLLRANSYYEAQCLSYSLFSFEKNIQTFMDGSTGQGELDKVRLFNLLTSLTTESKEHQKIASVLSALDAKIELNNRINAELEAMAKTLYDYWFVQFDFPSENGKPYKSSGGKMIWNSELKREIPDGWEVGILQKIVNIFDSKRVPLSNMQRADMKGHYPYYGATGIMDYVNDFIFDGEYILLAEDGSVMDEKGFPIVQYVWGKTWVNNHAHVLKPKNDSNYEYLFHLLKSISVIQIMTGSIQKKINQDNLLTVKIPFPNTQILSSFSKFATPIRKQIINIIEENQKLAELRDWLLPMLMNGQITVRDTEKIAA